MHISAIQFRVVRCSSHILLYACYSNKGTCQLFR